VTVAPLAEVAEAATLAGQAIEGGVTSATVTVKEQVEGLLAVSRAVQVMVVTPSGKLELEAGTQVILATPEQASEAVGAAYVTTAEH
jgi:hypothetical protein